MILTFNTIQQQQHHHHHHHRHHNHNNKLTCVPYLLIQFPLQSQQNPQIHRLDFTRVWSFVLPPLCRSASVNRSSYHQRTKPEDGRFFRAPADVYAERWKCALQRVSFFEEQNARTWRETVFSAALPTSTRLLLQRAPRSQR